SAADQDIIRDVQQILDYADLILNLRTADDRRKWTLRFLQRFAENLQLFLHQKTGYCRQMMRNSLRRSMSPVSSAESIVHIDVRKFSQLLGKFRIILLFPWIEAHVLEQKNISVIQL